ncbi:BnaA09g08630D [Brassica napus]|uniref:BnaA09g08630D protein n=1 Tax=Brassica napus TaxID=3708 RepID=A0A078HH82_BRANA|nr:BnaA09g08630D [Brassica napus]
MDPNTNPNDRINLDLSLGIGPHAKDPVEQHGKFMELLRSVSDSTQNAQPSPPLPPLHTMPPGYYNLTYPQNAAGQLLLPPITNQGGVGALETPRPGTRLGRPPGGHHARRNSSKAAATVEENVEKDIIPPYPWATTRPARIHNLRYLYVNNINVIFGQEVLRHRASKVWSCPKLTPCCSCKNGMKPVIGENKEEINWLFLLLGQMLGCCTLDQLSSSHATYLVYDSYRNRAGLMAFKVYFGFHRFTSFKQQYTIPFGARGMESSITRTAHSVHGQVGA